MSGTTLGTANVLIGADDAKLQASLASINASLEKQLSMMSLTFQKVGSSMDKAGNKGAVAGAKIKKGFKESIAAALSLERMAGRIAFMGVIGGAMALKNALQTTFLDGIKDAREFESALAHVNTVLDKSASHFLAQYKREVSDLSVSLGEGVKDLSGALYDITSARISPENSMQILSETSKLAIGNMAELRDVTSSVITIMKAYGYEETKVVEITDMLQASIKYGRMELSEMAPVLGDVTAQAAVFGIRIQDVLGTLATMTRGGLSAKKSITSMRRAFIALSKDAEISSMIQKNGFLSVIPLIESMSVKQQMIATGGVRGFNTVAVAMRDYANAGEDVQAMLEETGEAQAAFDKQMDTSAKKLEQAKEGWKREWREIGESGKDANTAILLGLTNILQMIRNTNKDIGLLAATFPTLGRAVNAIELAFPSVGVKFRDMLWGIKEDTSTSIDAMSGAWGNYWAGFNEMYGYTQPDEQRAIDIEGLEKKIIVQKEILALAKLSGNGEIKARNELISLQESLMSLEEARHKKFLDFSSFQLSFLKSEKELQTSKNEALEEDVALLKKIESAEARIEKRKFKGENKSVITQEIDAMINKDKFTGLTASEILDESSIFGVKGAVAKALWGVDGDPKVAVAEFERYSLGIYAKWFDTMDEMMTVANDVFISPFMTGFDMLMSDILNGENMMKKNFGEYMKAIADAFIMQMTRMLVSALLLKAVLSALGMGGTASFKDIVVSQVTGRQLGNNSAPSFPPMGGTGEATQSSSPTNVNNTFSPQNNVNARFSRRDLGFMYREGKKYENMVTV